MPNHEKWSHPWTVDTSCLLMSKNSINWCLDAGIRKSEQKLIVLPCLHSPPYLFRCLLSRKFGTQSHSAKFLNWGDHVNSVPDLAASPPCRPPVWYETTKKDIDKYDFPLLDCTQEQSGNKTGHRNNTATKWPDKPLWGTRAYREHQRMRYFSSGHALKKSSFTLFLKTFRTVSPRNDVWSGTSVA